MRREVECAVGELLDSRYGDNEFQEREGEVEWKLVFRFIRKGRWDIADIYQHHNLLLYYTLNEKKGYCRFITFFQFFNFIDGNRNCRLFSIIFRGVNPKIIVKSVWWFANCPSN